MNYQIKKVLILAAGWLCIFIGIIGLFLPFLQGILFLLLGLYILSHESPTAKRILLYLKKRYPSVNYHLERVKKKGKKIIKNILNKK